MGQNIISIVISLIFLSLFGVMLKAVIPSKRTLNAVTFALSVVFAFYTLNFFKGIVNFDTFETAIIYDTETYTNEYRLKNEEFVKSFFFLRIKNALKDKYINIESARIELEEENDIYSVKKILLNINDLSYLGYEANIDIVYITKDTVAEILNLEEGAVVVCG